MRRWFTLARTLAIACALLVAATVWIVLRSANRESLEDILRVEAPAGLRAFEERRFLEAEQRLGRAVAALDGLGRSGLEADETRQVWREAVAWANLSPLTPEELPAAAREAVAQRGLDGWRADLAAHYRGKWFILAPATVSRRGDRYVIDWSFADGSRLYAESTGDEPAESSAPPALAAADRMPRELVFAAPIADVRREPDGAWAVVLDADRAVPITRFEHLPDEVSANP